MAKVEATEERTFRVKSPISKVYDAFAKPEEVKKYVQGLERHEFIGDNTARWILLEKKEKGTKFQADYTVVYEGNGTDYVAWHSTAGNLGTKGEVHLKSISDEVTEIRYKETLTPDLPIPRLMAKVFRPIVSREVRKGLTDFLDGIEQALGRA